MTDRGEFLNQSLSEIRLSSDGASVQLFLTDSVSPHRTAILACDNVLAFHVHRTADDAIPYFIGEVKWQPVACAGQAQLLGRLGYSFLDEGGDALLPSRGQVILLHFEGSICGDVVCNSCSVSSEQPVHLSSSAS